MFVVDCSNPDDFEASKEALYKALPHIPHNSILLIAANKADISGVDPYVLLLKHFDLYDIQQKGNFRALNIFHMSAKSGVISTKPLIGLSKQLQAKLFSQVSISIMYAFIKLIQDYSLVVALRPQEKHIMILLY